MLVASSSIEESVRPAEPFRRGGGDEKHLEPREQLDSEQPVGDERPLERRAHVVELRVYRLEVSASPERLSSSVATSRIVSSIE
ncbi:MAG: hypothetical protein NZL88_00805 [Gaiellaceae bacterium]|nr:hypothetical protein [Gaiellaceae bacterium]